MYEKNSGQSVNFSKTNATFSKGVSAERIKRITLFLDIREVLSHDKYLGVPTFNRAIVEKSIFAHCRLY